MILIYWAVCSSQTSTYLSFSNNKDTDNIDINFKGILKSIEYKI